MVMTLSGSRFFASAAYTVLSDDRTSFGRIKIAAAGTGPYDPKATRWGDYSAAVLDPRVTGSGSRPNTFHRAQVKPRIGAETGERECSKFMSAEGAVSIERTCCRPFR
jgi:hypothetical protein